MTTSGASGPREGLTEATVSGVRWISLARLVGEVVAFTSMVALARLIAPNEFGEFAIAMLVSEIALATTGGGIAVPLVQRPELGRAHLEAGMFIGLVTGIVLGALVFVTAPLIFTPLFGASTTTLVQLTTPIFLISAISAVPQAVVERRLDFRLIALVQMIAVIVRAATSLVLAVAGMEAEALVLAAVAANLVMMILLLAFARVPWPRPRISAAREIIGFGTPSAMSALSWTGFRNADFAIVGARLGSTGLGFYWRAYQLGIEYQRKIGTAVNHQIAFPVYSRAEDLGSMLALRARLARAEGAILIPALAALAVLAPVLVPWLFGSAWEPAVVPTQILAVAGILTIPNDTVGAAVLAAGRARAWMIYHLGCLAVYAGAIYIAAGYGLNAVCAAVVGVQALATMGAYSGVLYGLVDRPLLTLWRDFAPGAAGAAALAAVGLPLTLAFRHVDAPPLLTLSVVGTAGALACVLTIRSVSPATFEDLGRLMRRVFGGRFGRRLTARFSVATAWLR
jgi:O-antigen/teichoic acid export membrane protein